MRHKLVAEVKGHKKVDFKDDEFVIRGKFWIDEQEYSFKHYEDVYDLTKIEFCTKNMSASFDCEEACLIFKRGEKTAEGQLLKHNLKSSIKKVDEEALTYKVSNLKAWIARFNFMVYNIGPYDFELTRCVAMPDDKYICTIDTPSPECVIVHNFGFDDDEKPKVQSPFFPNVDLLETDADIDYIEHTGQWLYEILVCGLYAIPDDDEVESGSKLPLNEDQQRIEQIEEAIGCPLTFYGFPKAKKKGQLILFEDIRKEYEKSQKKGTKLDD